MLVKCKQYPSEKVTKGKKWPKICRCSCSWEYRQFGDLPAGGLAIQGKSHLRAQEVAIENRFLVIVAAQNSFKIKFYIFPKHVDRLYLSTLSTEIYRSKHQVRSKHWVLRKKGSEFYFSGILISFTWLAYCRNSPSEMPWITPEELDFISENNRQVQKLEIRQYPIKSILTSLPFLSVIYSGIAGGFIDFTVIRFSFQNDLTDFRKIQSTTKNNNSYIFNNKLPFSMLPKYIKQALGSDLLKTGIESSLPYLFQLIFVIGSCIGLGKSSRCEQELITVSLDRSNLLM